MPFRNEHSARLRNPDEFDPKSFRRTKDGLLFGRIKVPDTVSVIWARLKVADEDDPPIAQSLRFPISHWTAAEAKAWLTENKIKYIEFSPAVGARAMKAARWTTRYKNDLPDSAFLYIEPGGKKDKEGKTVPRSKRHFPYKDANGKIDLPHLRNALARIPQSNLPEDVKKRLMEKARRILKRVQGAAEVLVLTESGSETVKASQDEPAKIRILAYSGGPMEVSMFPVPVIVDVQGMEMPDTIPILYGHDRSKPVGHGKPSVQNGALYVEAVLSVPSQESEVVAKALANQFPWQASLGVAVLKTKKYKEGSRVEANGRTITAGAGGLVVVERSVLQEVSVVCLGADASTEVKLAANKKENGLMSQEQDVDKLKADAAKEERERLQKIERLCAGFDSPEVAELKKKAIEAEITIEALSAQLLELVRASRPKAPEKEEGENKIQGSVLEAACLKAALISDKELVEKYGEEVVEAAATRYPRGIGLQQLIMEAAWANGYQERFFTTDPVRALKAAFSTLDLPGIMSNVANKILLDSFNYVEDTWRSVAEITSVKDFKTRTSYRLTGDMVFEEVAPDGELKSGTLDEESYTIRAKTYGKLFSITRTDIINDDLGALTQVPKKIGMGAALKLNNVFWGTFLNNSTFFTAARGNFDDGADSALSIDGLSKAEQMFLEMRDADGNLIGIRPAYLLVPPALSALASQLMRSTELRDTTASTKYGTANPHAGKFKPVVSAYLSDTTLTGYSSTAWYLLADPNAMAVIEIAFLNGQQAPTVEQAEADFDQLGIKIRGYFDFGVALKEWRGGVKMAGA